MKMKILTLFTIFLILLPTLSGCWNYREISDLALVSGVAIDRDYTGNHYHVTVEIVTFSLAGRGATISSRIIQSGGATIFDAARNMIKTSPKRLYWGHCMVIILSESLSKEGIIEVLDWFSRDQETRSEAVILISKEATAAEIIMKPNTSGNPTCFEIYESINSQDSLSKAPKVEIYKFINTLGNEGIASTLPVIASKVIDTNQTYEISGTAIFKQEKQVGYIDGEDTKYFLFVTDQLKGGLLVEKDSPDKPHPNITLEINESKTKVKPTVIDDELAMQVDIKIMAAIAELGTSNNLIEKAGMEKLKTNAANSLEDNINELIKKVQREYGSDIFGFGRVVKSEMPEFWRSEASNWEEIFKNLQVNVHVEIEINNSAFTSKPIKIGD